MKEPDNGWSIEAVIGSSQFYVVGGDGDTVAHVFGNLGLGVTAQERAQLISASPDLLKAAEEGVAALCGAIGVLGDVANLGYALGLLQDAIKKAKGEKE